MTGNPDVPRATDMNDGPFTCLLEFNDHPSGLELTDPEAPELAAI